MYTGAKRNIIIIILYFWVFRFLYFRRKFDVSNLVSARTQTNSRHAPKYLLLAELGILPV